MTLHFADYLIILVYFIFVITVGFLIKRKIKSSNDFLSSSRSIPLWITSLAFISANPRCAGGVRHGSVGRQVWHYDGSFLLGWRHLRYGVLSGVYDAILLWQ